MDSNKRLCGYNDTKYYPYLYMVMPKLGYLNRSVCVKTCPQIMRVDEYPNPMQCYPNQYVPDCNFHYPMDLTYETLDPL